MVVETLFYETLEVSVTASDTEIKKSYRRLALLHHPDKAPNGDPTKFQEIQNAWEVLGDPDKREEYDRYGSKSSGGGRGGGRGGMEDDLFESMFGGMGGMGSGRRQPPSQRRKEQASPSVVHLNVSLEDLYNGKEKKLEVARTRTCGTCKGSGAKAKAKAKKCVKCGGQGIVMMMRVMGPFATRVPMECDACEGTGEKVRAQDWCKKCSGKKVVTEKKRVEFSIERGIMPGEKIVLRNEGDETPDSSSPGDLQIIVDLIPHSTFTIRPPLSLSRPSDLSTTLSLTLSESLLGFSRLILRHLDGRGLRVTQPGPGEKGWRVLKTDDEVCIKGAGMWRKGSSGDLICKIEVEMPGDDWASTFGAEKLAVLEKLLPPKRPSIEEDNIEAGEVDLEPVTPASSSSSRSPPPPPHHHHTHSHSTDEESEDDGQPGCHQQ